MSRGAKVLLLVVLFLVISALTRPGRYALLRVADKDVLDAGGAYLQWYFEGLEKRDFDVLNTKNPIEDHNYLFFSTLTLDGKVRAVGFFGLSVPVGK